MPTKPIEQIQEEDEDHNLITESNKNPLCFSRLSTDRPRTAGGAFGSIILDQQKQPEINVSFSISSRLPASPQATIQTRNPIQYKESDEQKSTGSSSVSTVVLSQKVVTSNPANDTGLTVGPRDKDQSLNEYRRMFFLPSELNVSQIIDNPKVFDVFFFLFTIPSYFKRIKH